MMGSSANPVISASLVTETALLLKSLRELMASLGDPESLDRALQDLTERAAKVEAGEHELAERERAHNSEVNAHKVAVENLAKAEKDLNSKMVAANTAHTEATRLQKLYEKRMADLKAFALATAK